MLNVKHQQSTCIFFLVVSVGKKNDTFPNSFCLSDSPAYLFFYTVHRDVFPQLYTLSSFTQICTSFPHCYKAEAIMLTVASLQSPFNGTSVPASLGTVTGGRWGDWLWLLAMYGPASCSSYSLCHNLLILSQVSRDTFASVNPLSLMHDCHSSGWWLYDPYESALSRRHYLQPLLLFTCLPSNSIIN